MCKGSVRLLALLGITASATVSLGCVASVTANSVLIEKADAIIRVETVGYSIPPATADP